MDALIRAAHYIRLLAAGLTVALAAVAGIAGAPVRLSAQTGESPAEARLWPCRLIVKPTLLGVIEDGWKRSPTLRGQCEELAGARTVVALEWGKTDAQSQALTRIRFDKEGVVVATVAIPPVADAIELVAHELEHILERVRGVDFAAECKKRGSGVWRAFGGYETQAAIDVGRQVRKELVESRRPLPRIKP